MQHNSEKEFLTIINGCINKDRAFQNKLYEMYYAYGFSVCIRYLNNQDDAYSVLNKGFLKVFTHIKKYDTTKQFTPWFRKILVNTALNFIKKQNRNLESVDLDKVQHQSKEEDAHSKIEYKELVSMIQLLPTAYRNVFNLYVMEGFKHREISTMLNISEGTSKSNLNRARLKLQTMLQKKHTL